MGEALGTLKEAYLPWGFVHPTPRKVATKALLGPNPFLEKKEFANLKERKVKKNGRIKGP